MVQVCLAGVDPGWPLPAAKLLEVPDVLAQLACNRAAARLRSTATDLCTHVLLPALLCWYGRVVTRYYTRWACTGECVCSAHKNVQGDVADL